jgi:aminocarboxymuconate-semialdehyde decarboxylase
MPIDVHSHYFPTEYLDLLDSFGGSQTGTAIAKHFLAGKDPGDLDARFRMLSDAGIDLQILSASPQVPYFKDPAKAVEAARLANDLYAELVRQYPKKFLAFVSLPLPHIDASLAELERGLDKLGMVGATATTAVLDKPIADPAFEPVFAELDRRKAILFIHPVGLACGSPAISAANLTWPIGAPFEDTLCVLQLMQAGVPLRYPNVRIIASHLGGTLPFLMRRLDHQAPWFMTKVKQNPSVLARSFWFDSVNGHPPSLRCACQTYGADRILFGTDFPYWEYEMMKLCVSYIQDAGLPTNDVKAILDGNAMGLFGARPPVRS